MDNQQRFAILVTASAGAIAVVVASGSFDSWDTIAGLTLVLILGAYGKELDATGRMRIAYGTVWALCVILVVGVGIEPLVRIPSVNSLLTDLVRRLPQVLKPTVIGLSLRNLVGFILWVILAVLRTAAYQGGR